MKDFLFFSFHGCSLVCASTTVFRSVHFLLPFGKMTKEKKSYNAIQQQKTIKTNCLFFKLLFFVFFFRFRTLPRFYLLHSLQFYYHLFSLRARYVYCIRMQGIHLYFQEFSCQRNRVLKIWYNAYKYWILYVFA